MQVRKSLVSALFVLCINHNFYLNFPGIELSKKLPLTLYPPPGMIYQGDLTALPSILVTTTVQTNLHKHKPDMRMKTVLYQTQKEHIPKISELNQASKSIKSLHVCHFINILH